MEWLRNVEKSAVKEGRSLEKSVVKEGASIEKSVVNLEKGAFNLEKEGIQNLGLKSLTAIHAAQQKEKSFFANAFSRLREAREQAHTKEMQKRLSGDYRSRVQGHASWLLQQFWFNSLVGVMIVFNLLLVIVETDAGASDVEAPAWTKAFGVLVIMIFTFEMLLRLYVQELGFWLDGLNIFEFLIVSMDVLMNVIELIAGPVLSVSVLRVVRLCKLARVAKAFHVCTELRLLLEGLLGCMKSIFWGAVLLVLALLIFSIIAVQFLHPLNKEIAAEGVYSDCERCGRVYASVFDAFLIFFQQIVAGDAWSMVTVEMIEKHPNTLWIYGSLYLFVGLAVLNLILGVVVDVASQARSQMQGELEDDALVQRMEYQHQLLDVCKAMDADGGGELDKAELLRGYRENTEFRESLDAIGIQEDEIDILWTIIDEDKSGTINYVEFVTTCYKMKHSHEEFMLAYIKYYITIIKAEICEEIALVKEEMRKDDENMEYLSKAILTEEEVIDECVDKIDHRTETMETKIDGLIDGSEVLTVRLKNAEQSSLGTTNGLEGAGAPILRDTADTDMKTSNGAVGQTTLQSKDWIAKHEKATINGCPQTAARPQKMSNLTSDGNKMLSDVLDAIHVRQEEVLTAINGVKRKLDQSFEKQIQPVPTMLTNPSQSSACRVPKERASNELTCPASSPACCKNSPPVKVVNLAPASQERA